MADRISEHINAPDAPSVTSLVGGIVADLQTLIRQEVTLARTEVKQEWEKTKSAAGAMVAGVVLSALAGMMFCFMLVHFLNWLNPDALPLWACYLIVAVVFGFFGGICLAAGQTKAGHVHVIPPETAQTIKENVPWIQNPK
jgi:hypothetical protein